MKYTQTTLLYISIIIALAQLVITFMGTRQTAFDTEVFNSMISYSNVIYGVSSLLLLFILIILISKRK